MVPRPGDDYGHGYSTMQTLSPLTGPAATTMRALPLAPAELVLGINAEKTGYSHYVLAHRLVQEAFEGTLEPNALALWRETHGSIEAVHTQITALKKESKNQPGAFEGLWEQNNDVITGVGGGVLGGFLGGVMGGVLSGVLSGVLGSVGAGVIGGLFGMVGGTVGGMAGSMAGGVVGILSAFVGAWLLSQGVDPILAFLGGWGIAVVSGPLLGGALAALHVRAEGRKKSAQLEADIAAMQALIHDYATFADDKTAALAE